MLISHAAISAGVIGFPRFGACAKAEAELKATMSTTADTRSLCVHMLHLPGAVDSPGRDGIVVLTREGCYGRSLRRLAAHGHDLGARRLRVAGLVPRAALQYRCTSVPAPWNA